MKKLFVLIISLLVFIPNINAVSSNEVDYEVYDYIVDANIDISGNLKVKEIIGIKGTFNGYIRDLVYKNSNLSEFTGVKSDFEGSAIYNASNVDLYKVGSISWEGKLDFTAFNEEITEFDSCNKETLCYEESKITNGISIKMYNETKDDITYFYIEYLLGNVVVMHNDVAEVYFNFVGDMFDDEIKNYQLRLLLPDKTKEQVRVWAHGPLTGEVYLISDEIDESVLYYGGYMTVSDLPNNTPIDMRLTFPKSLIMVDHPFLKKSNIDALDKIIEIETERADAANLLRKEARIKVYGTYAISGVYILLTLILIVYIYIKYDKEPKASFEGEYFRDFIDEYDVTVIEYLFNKKITEKAFSTSILNMIYKKNITFTNLDKKEYQFTKVSEDNLTDAEKLVMDIIFNAAGNGKTTTLKQIKNYGSKLVGTDSPFLNKFETWKYKVIADAEKQNFYENHSKVKLYFIIHFVIGILVLLLSFRLNTVSIVTFLVAITMGAFLIYVVSFTKRTIRGSEHHAKWKAFKKFLEDFGRFDEKELPEITLWERYLVYASIFGVADKVSETMKIKFNEINTVNSNGDFVFDYILWSNLNKTLSRTVNNSIATAHTKVVEAKSSEISSSSNSSGGGFGGGFSGGGGFGGGGGGGRGF